MSFPFCYWIFLRSVFRRILEIQADVLLSESFDLFNIDYFETETKVGSDGTSGLSVYKLPSNINRKDEASVFLTSIVPMKIYAICKNRQKILIWKNPKPSSTRYCRPVKIHFTKETKKVAEEENNRLEDCFHNVPDFNINFTDNLSIPVKFSKKTFSYTMLDGKVINNLTNTKSHSTCRICKATTSQLNNIHHLLSREIDRDALSYSLCPMHSRIRFLDLVLNVSYRDEDGLRVKYQTVDQDAIKRRKRCIQDKFLNEMSLRVDFPSAQGSGNTNDGNTSRRIFADYDKASQITGFDKTIMQRFGVILDTINSGYEVDIEKFRSYCIKTAELYTEKYFWWTMNAGVHIVLIHGADIIASLKHPVGELSEEAQECRNKDLKRIRTFNTRKRSLKSCNYDTLTGMLTASDPLIATINYRKQRNKSKKVKPIRKEVIELLATPEDPDNLYESSSDDEN